MNNLDRWLENQGLKLQEGDVCISTTCIKW
jgi:hypothetical protein